ncbi:MAG TPA: undecaprenyl-diphosphate phosphatase [Vicinamibacterales bacterium]|nr:undecaprenyl-diphosphate phosphatase [Vicinamibacterales bacterium]HOQ62175.1 undecaprenyl-diphosphate phosphatase [Vicinamibacterales bacterium]HPK72424.1 undecaprenyl-diphosphate phosphatase [Vicinamibacterales bacterium]
MVYLAAVALGIVQGLTEFLPVSSSAHLILARMFFGWDTGRFGLAFDVACHVGTLAAVAVYFRTDLLALARAVPGLARSPAWPADGPGRRLRLIAVGSVPVAVVGLLFADDIEAAVRTPWVAVASLAAIAVLFLAVERAGQGRHGEEHLSAPAALAIGVAQAAALVPGVSRSGATIATGMIAGLRRDAAAAFSFLLGVPAIGAAALHEGHDLLGRGLTAGDAALFLIGMTVSAAVGFVTIKYLLRYLASHTLAAFAWYRLGLAAAAALWLLARGGA